MEPIANYTLLWRALLIDHEVGLPHVGADPYDFGRPLGPEKVVEADQPFRLGNLFVTRRHKELIILADANHRPQDIELILQVRHWSIRPHGVAELQSDTKAGDTPVVCCEVTSNCRQTEPVLCAVWQTIAEDNGIEVGAICLVRSGGVPKPTSISRQLRKSIDWSGIAQGKARELSQRFRIGQAPGDSCFGFDAIEVADQQQVARRRPGTTAGGPSSQRRRPRTRTRQGRRAGICQALGSGAGKVVARVAGLPARLYPERPLSFPFALAHRRRSTSPFFSAILWTPEPHGNRRLSLDFHHALPASNGCPLRIESLESTHAQ